MNTPKAIPKKRESSWIATFTLAGLVLAILGGVQFVRLIREVNEPPPKTFPKQAVERRLASWGVKVSVLQVLYVNLDDQVFIARVKPSPENRAPWRDQPLLPTKSTLLANGEAILAITRPFNSPESLSIRQNRLDKIWQELDIDRIHKPPHQ